MHRFTADCTDFGSGFAIATAIGIPTRNPNATRKYGYANVTESTGRCTGTASASISDARITAAAARRWVGLLRPASLRANHVTPTMYRPTTIAKCHRWFHPNDPASTSDSPSSTLRTRQAAMLTGPIGV